MADEQPIGNPTPAHVCPCGLPFQQPWRTRNDLWSPASFILGLFIVGFGVLAVVGIKQWVGWLIFGLMALAVAAAFSVQVRRRHRRACLVLRSIWFGVATPGAPLRIILNLPG